SASGCAPPASPASTRSRYRVSTSSSPRSSSTSPPSRRRRTTASRHGRSSRSNVVDRRRPRRVYGTGDEPDPRFTLANERTLLAWMRTALALVVAGIAVTALAELGEPIRFVKVTSGLAFLAGAVTAVVGWRQWYRAEKIGRA